MLLITAVTLLTADARNAYFKFFVETERILFGTGFFLKKFGDVKIFQAFQDQRSTQVSSMDSSPETPVKFKPRPDMYKLEEAPEGSSVLNKIALISSSDPDCPAEEAKDCEAGGSDRTLEESLPHMP
jgi:hypothetical protein